MHEAPRNISRKVVPRWRRIQFTPPNETGGQVRTGLQPLDITQEVEAVRNRWFATQDLNSAAELLFLASFGGEAIEYGDAAQFIVGHPAASAELKGFAKSLLATELISPSLLETSFRDDPAVYRGQIRGYRKRLGEYPRDPIGHVELARLYSSVGQLEKAAEHFRIAINLAETNRFVLRAAARFYVHADRFDDALNALRMGPKRDPWLLASRISIADLAGKPVESWKDSNHLLEDSKDLSQIAELAAAVATLELKSGKVSRAKKFLKLASKSPNDNVVAQLQWASRVYGFHFDESLLKRRFTFEAATSYALLAEQWKVAAEACLKWLFDEPFSVRPALVGGFLASTALKDHSLSQMFLRQGLLANPNDSAILNNLAYSLIMSGDLDDAEEELLKAQKHASRQQRDIILTATEGLLHYRRGDTETGAKLYLQSIANAAEQNEHALKHEAFFNFCFEELRLGRRTPILNEGAIEKLYGAENVERRIKLGYKLILQPMLLASKQWGPQSGAHTEYSRLLADRLPAPEREAG